MGILVYIGACLWAHWIQTSIYTSVLVSIPDFDILACSSIHVWSYWILVCNMYTVWACLWPYRYWITVYYCNTLMISTKLVAVEQCLLLTSCTLAAGPASPAWTVLGMPSSCALCRKKYFVYCNEVNLLNCCTFVTVFALAYKYAECDRKVNSTTDTVHYFRMQPKECPSRYSISNFWASSPEKP
jgi:hypothetical protein